ncbi:MAG: hypothetical protein SGPRY_000382 [Prymnesium sp.]
MLLAPSLGFSPQPRVRAIREPSHRAFSPLAAAGEWTVALQKPLGLLLEERDRAGVCVSELVAGGAGAASGEIAPGDVLVRVHDSDVTTASFDAVMQMIIDGPDEVVLTLSDGLGRFDVTPNLGNSLKPEDAMLVDRVVSQSISRSLSKQRE